MPLVLPPDAVTQPPAPPPMIVDSLPPLLPADEPPEMQLPGAANRRQAILTRLGQRLTSAGEALRLLATGDPGRAADRVEWLEGSMSGTPPGMTPHPYARRS